jgi:thiol-disulfide isomerase/thioredoxin
VLLVFTDPSCGPCNAMLPRISEWQHDDAEQLTIAVLTRGSADDNRAKVREHGVASVWLDPELEAYNAYKAVGTPGAVLVDESGRIASSVVAGADAIARLVDEAFGRPEAVPVMQVQPAPSAPPVGADAPALELFDLDGRAVTLTEESRDTLVLFWNPSCGFCQRMLDDVLAFERLVVPGAPRLLLISTGSVQDNRAMGLTSTIALDPQFAAGQMFGSTGTPSGILVGSDGKVASGLAVGAPAVMALTMAPSEEHPS